MNYWLSRVKHNSWFQSCVTVLSLASKERDHAEGCNITNFRQPAGYEDMACPAMPATSLLQQAFFTSSLQAPASLDSWVWSGCSCPSLSACSSKHSTLSACFSKHSSPALCRLQQAWIQSLSWPPFLTLHQHEFITAPSTWHSTVQLRPAPWFVAILTLECWQLYILTAHTDTATNNTMASSISHPERKKKVNPLLFISLTVGPENKLLMVVVKYSGEIGLQVAELMFIALRRKASEKL